MVQYIPAVDHSQAVLGWLAIQKKPLDLNTTGSLLCSSTCIHSFCGWKALVALYTKVAMPNSSDSGVWASPKSSCFQPAAKDALSKSNLQRMPDMCHMCLHANHAVPSKHCMNGLLDVLMITELATSLHGPCRQQRAKPFRPLHKCVHSHWAQACAVQQLYKVGHVSFPGALFSMTWKH